MVRRLRLAGVFFAGVGSAIPGAPSVSPMPSPSDLGSTLTPIIAKHKTPGMVALVLQGDQVVAQGAAGVRKAGSPEVVTLDDKFHLGSDTKAMTATLLAQLVEEGKLTWSTTLGEIFDGMIGRESTWKNVTLQQLLAHRAGFAANPDDAVKATVARGTASLTEQRKRIVADAFSRPPQSTPGSTYLYSNTGYIIAGAVVEKITGRAWEDVMRDRLFAPLGIASGGFGAPSADGTRAQPWGHHANGQPATARADNPAFYGPAGAAHMTIGDWAKFISLHLRGDPASPHRQAKGLKAESFAALHTPPHGEDYFAGWMVTTRPWAKGSHSRDTGRVLTHSGSNTMWFCTTWLAPEIDFAVLVACNQGGDEAAAAADEVAGALVRQFARKSR